MNCAHACAYPLWLALPSVLSTQPGARLLAKSCKTHPSQARASLVSSGVAVLPVSEALAPSGRVSPVSCRKRLLTADFYRAESPFTALVNTQQLSEGGRPLCPAIPPTTEKGGRGEDKVCRLWCAGRRGNRVGEKKEVRRPGRKGDGGRRSSSICII